MKYNNPVINDSIPLRNSNNFNIVTFDCPLYFSKLELIMLVIFAYIPFLISFNVIFQFSSNFIYYRLVKINFFRTSKKQT